MPKFKESAVSNAIISKHPANITPLLRVRVDCIPSALTSRRQWMLWKYETAKGKGGKPTKVPYQTNGSPAASNNPATWCSFTEAARAYEQGNAGFSGMGFALKDGDGLTGIDLDGCIAVTVDASTGFADPETIAFAKNERGEIAEEIYVKFAGKAYIEISPSGTGLRMFVKGAAPRSGKGSAHNGHNFIEVYDHKSPRYLTITGNACYVPGEDAGAVEPQDAQEELNWLDGKYMTQTVPVTGTEADARPMGVVFLPAPESADDAVIALLKNSPHQKDKFERLFDGKGLSRSDDGNEPPDDEAGEAPTLWETRTGEQQDWSSLDMQLLEQLAWATNRDEEQMLRIYKRAFIYRDEKMETLRAGVAFGRLNVKKAINLHREGGRKTYGQWMLEGITAPLFGVDGTEAASEDPNFAWVAEFNERYSPVLYGGKMAVAFEQFDAGLNRHTWQFVSFTTFEEMHCSEMAVTGYKAGKPIAGAKGKGWLNHPLRSPKRDHYFDPAQPPKLERAGYLNLWGGLNVTGDARKGDAMPMVNHIRTIISGEEEALTNYIMRWLALLIQKPGYRHEVALVLRGEKGCGKGTLGNLLCRIFGGHGLAIVQGRHFTGNFNAHLQDCCFLFADEAFFAGRKEDGGVLKGLITEPTVTIEPKGRCAFTAPNRLSVLMATNSEFAVPASKDERRYAVADVSSGKVGNREYWNALHGWMSKPDNIAAFVKYMQAVDISNYDPREFIETRALAEQRAHSLEPWAQWWGSALLAGAFTGKDWCQYAKPSDLHRLFLDYCDRHRIDKHGRITLEAMGKKLLKHKLVSARDTHRISNRCDLLDDLRLSDDQRRAPVRCRHLGTLDEARVAFIKAFKLPADTFDVA